jgi:hypothetical protein
MSHIVIRRRESFTVSTTTEENKAVIGVFFDAWNSRQPDVLDGARTRWRSVNTVACGGGEGGAGEECSADLIYRLAVKAAVDVKQQRA